MPPDNDSWEKHQELILFRLDELGKGIDEVKKEATNTRIDVAQLKVKSSVWGALGGGVVAAIGALVAAFKG